MRAAVAVVALLAAATAAVFAATPAPGQQFLVPEMQAVADTAGFGPARLGTSGNTFVASILGAGTMNNTYSAGQELRLLVASAYATNTSYHEMMRKSSVGSVRGRKFVDTYHISELLKKTKLGNYSLLPAFNTTGPTAVRVRVIAAHSSRTATSGAVVPCSSTSQDVWAEFWSMSPRTLAFGRQMVYSGFVTFTAPPFNFRFCVKDVSRVNGTKAGVKTDTGVNAGWMEFGNQRGAFSRFTEPGLLWRMATSTRYPGDYAGIEVLGNMPLHSNLAIRSSGAFNYTAFTFGDSVKLVPFGYPCTYEKEDNRMEYAVATSATRTDQYCGANAVAQDGSWLNSNCQKEGSVAGGVARVGARTANAFASSSSTKTSAWSNSWTRRVELVAYLQLPAVGQYDVCVSTRLWRKMSAFMSSQVMKQEGGYAANSMPVWQKAYDASSSTGCAAVKSTDGVENIVTSCQPRKTAFVVSAAASTVTWSTTDETPATWGEIKFTASSGTLNYGAATAWDLSSAQNYYELTGGDQFRLVPEYYFLETSTKTTGDLASTVQIRTAQSVRSTTTSSAARASATYSASDLTTAGVGKFTQYALGTPDYGSQATVGAGSGCFWQGSDNYGATSLFGNPGTTCCTSAPCSEARWCALSDSGVNGATASADLGGNPRVGYSPWALDGTGTNAWAYVRFPAAGQFRVCYKQAGTSTWRVISGASTSMTNGTLVPKKLNSGFTYHFNDSRGETWGPVAIKSLSGNTLDKQAWNYYTSSSATAVGSALKMVKTTESCYTSTAQSRTYSMNPGSLEGTSSLGSADDSTTLTSMIYFYVKVPAYSTTIKYRVCFRPAAQNWHALSDPNFVAHDYMTVSNEFGPRPSASLTFTLTDSQTGGWGKFVFNRSYTTTSSLNIDVMSGDMVRLVPNVTTTGIEVGCDRVYGLASTATDLRYKAQAFDATKADTNLGLACAVESSVSTDPCYGTTLKPTSNSVVSTTPYTDIYAGSDWNAIGLLDGSVAFVTLPTGLSGTQPVAYKVCYKQARFQNWIEAKSTTTGANFITVTTARTVTAAAPTGVTLQSGQYSYVALTAASASYPIFIQYDLVKLVPFASTCDAPAAMNAGYELYTAFSGVNTYSCVVDATNSTQITSSCGTSWTTLTARAYMTMPTVRTAAGTSSSYRVCYMPRTSAVTTQNWHDLSGTTAFAIKNHGIVYTALNRPYAQAMLGLRITSGSQLLDTRANMDKAKLVAANVPCADMSTASPVQPSGTTAASLHVGIEVGYTTAGITNVGPTDLQDVREARIDVVPPAASSYKVCYKPYGMDWLEILQASGTARVYALSTDYVQPTAAEVSKFTVAATLTGSYTNQPNYHSAAWGTVAVGGASTYDGTTNYFTVTYSTAPTASQTFKAKFVLSYTEEVEGTYVRMGDANCFSDGIEHTYTTSGTTVDNIRVNLPMMRGKYTVCVYSSTTGAWYQAPKDLVTNTVNQPMAIVSNKMAFAATAATNLLTVYDLHAENATSFGGLAGGDYVYIINATGGASACGSVNDYTNTAVATAKKNLTTSAHGADTTHFLATRMATITLPAAPRTGSYVVCVQRTQAAATNHSGTPPFVRANWYQVANGGTELGPNTNFLVVTAATKLNISGCPVFNTTYKLRTGRTFDITVRSDDATNTLVPFAIGTKRYEVTAVGTGYSLQSANGECAAADAASYGYTSGALSQFMSEGKVKYSLTSLSACPSGGCTLSFTSPTLTTSPVCTFDVQPTFIFGLTISSAPTTCTMGSWCSFRVVALHADGGVAHTVTSGATFAVAGWTSSNADAAAGTSTTGSLNGWSTNFANGVIDLKVNFKPNGYSTTASETVTLTVSANGKTSNTVSFTVYRPVLSAVHIVDVYPIAPTSGTPLLPLQPSWEPTTQFKGGDDINMGASSVTAAAGYHLVAGQTYAVTLRAVATTNGATAYATTQNIVPSGFSVDFSSAFKTTLSTAGNAILYGEGSEQNLQAFSAQSWSQSLTTKTFTFRLKNSAGCATSCAMPLTFANSVLTSTLTTPVRAVATKLRVVGCATTAAGLATSTATTCTGVASTVNKGWYINVSAVDEFGNVDTFFDGDVVAVFSGAADAVAARQGISLTTVSALVAGAAVSGAGHVKVTAVRGFATLAVTVSKPCASGCELQLMSTWGTNVAPAGSLVATPNTAKLMATLDTVLAYCSSTSTSECASVAGVSLANTTHAYSLIYKDTKVCMKVEAVDSNNMATLYETNWIGYFARDVTGGSVEALTLTDESSNTGFVQRYKPLKNSVARFCFTISGFTSARAVQVHFVAQRFGAAGTYWSHGTTGAAMVGPMRVWTKKVVAGVLLSSATGGDVVVGGTTGSVSASYTGSAFTLGLGFTLKDHYNNSIVAGEIASADMSRYLTMRMDSATGMPQVTNKGDAKVRGDLNVTLLASTVNVTSSALVANLNVNAACLGCTVIFELVDQANVVDGLLTLGSQLEPEFLGANVTLFVVNQDATAVRRLAFNPSTSPLTSYWINGTATTATTNAAPTYHVTSCFSYASGCVPKPASLNLALCDARGTTSFSSSATAGLKMRVYVMPSALSLTTAMEPFNGTAQVDIMNTYAVSVSFGNQLLSCRTGVLQGAACTNDNTAAPVQTLLAYGATVRDAVGNFYTLADAAIKTTNFFMYGLSTSSYLAINASTSGYDSTPSVGGAFSATATGTPTVSGLALTPSGAGFYFRPTAAATTLALLSTAADNDACNETMKYPRTAVNGLATSVSESSLGFAYASQSIPVGVAVPMTVEVHDAAGLRIAGASGSVAVSVASWVGCNNGGEPTFTGTVANGRATVWVTFTKPCQKCVLQWKLTPSGAQSSLYSAMNANPASLTVLSSQITVTGVTQAATEVAVTAATPASVLTALPTAVTTASAVTVTVVPRGNVGLIPFATTTTTTSVGLSLMAQSTSKNWWWVGNGGVLRATSTPTELYKHYQVVNKAVSAATTLTASFSRTCASCRMYVSYKVGSTVANNLLPSAFVVTTAATQLTLVGFAPTSVKVGQDIAVALWSTGSEDTSVPIAGVAPATTVGTAASPSFSATNNTNGDGGRLTATSWVFNNSQIHRLSFSAPCDTCTVSLSGNSVPVRVFTTATHLRPGPDATLTPEDMLLGTARAATVATLNQFRVLPLTALDDQGFVDQSAGAWGCGFPALKFRCVYAPVYPTVALTSDGAAGAFPVSGSTSFLMSNQAGVQAWHTTMVEGRTLYNMSFTTPQRNVIPVFSASVNGATVSSALTATRAFPVPKYSVSVGRTGLAISVVSSTSDLTKLTAYVSNTFHVALVGASPAGATSKYVAIEADNAVTVTASAGCPAYTINASSATLVAGYASYLVTFTAPTAVGATCGLTFTVGAGAGSCTAAADCTSTQTVVVSSLRATTFDILRPTVYDNGLRSTAIPMYAHAGRTMKLRTSVSGPDALGVYQPVTACTTCALTVTSSDCGFTSATATVMAGTSMAEVSLSFPDNNVAVYTCTITVSMTGPDATGTASTALSGPDRSTTSLAYSVSVCKSASVSLLTNTTSAYRGMVLKTGVAYDFYAVMLTSTGVQCMGDSQDDATTLSISAVDAVTNAAVSNLVAINVNATSTTTSAFAMGNMAAAARTSVQVVGGAFKFRVVFTNSTMNLGLAGGVKLRIAAASLSSVAMSGAVHTGVAGARLRWGKHSFSPFVVKSWPIVTGPMGATGVQVLAVDALPDAWYTGGLMSGMPNVAQNPAEFGNNAEVMWRVSPTPAASAAFPLSFTGGSATATLASGRTSWSSVAWTGTDGVYGLSVASSVVGIEATPEVAVRSQTHTQLMLDTRGFTTNPPSAATCTSSCVLPNGTFTTKQNATINGGNAFLSVDSLTGFSLTVLITDGTIPVRGDNNSVLALTLNSNAGTSVVMGVPPEYVTRGTLYARVVEGRATFNLGFLGDTLMAGGIEEFASLTVSCPTTRPAALLRAGESAANPCTLTTGVTTQTFQVVNSRPGASVLNSAAVISARSVIKAGLGLQAFRLVNVTLFKQRLVAALRVRGVMYLHGGNIDRVLGVMTCTVNSLFPAGGDLGSTVCGTNMICASPNNLASCPTGVEACGCPAMTARSLLLSRFLLQNTTAANTTTAMEMAYDLSRADSFPARTSAEVAAEYLRVQNATIDSLRTDPLLRDAFQIESVGTRSASAVVTTLPPTTAAVQPTSPPGPVNPPPSPVTSTPSSPSASVSFALALLLAALLALIA